MCPFTYKITLKGLVQGVGMRPFIYNLAKKFRLFGKVYNDTSAVIIVLNSDKSRLSSFIKALKADLPPLSRLDSVKISKLKYENFKNFYIE